MSKITRRDLIHGALTAPPALMASGAWADKSKSTYPPELTGLRGSHAGSFEVAHELGREGKKDFGPPVRIGEDYDLVVVGGGVSGLSAAYFYRQQVPGARILILDNHDDFGGHAKRNEFVVNGQRLIGYGGSQTMEGPSAYSDVAKGLLTELAVDLDAFYEAYDDDFFRRHGLRGGLFFDAQTYGKSAFVDVAMAAGDFLGLKPSAMDDSLLIDLYECLAQDFTHTI